MIVMIIYAIISFLLDGFLSNYMQVGIVDPSYFRTIFSVISIAIMINYFDDYKKYFYILVTLGVLFDIVYTNTFLLNACLFYVIYFIISKVNYYMADNVFTMIVKGYMAICLYHCLSYLLLMVAEYQYYPVYLLGNILVHSIISTIIYTGISYLVIKKIYHKLYVKKIR